MQVMDNPYSVKAAPNYIYVLIYICILERQPKLKYIQKFSRIHVIPGVCLWYRKQVIVIVEKIMS